MTLNEVKCTAIKHLKMSILFQNQLKCKRDTSIFNLIDVIDLPGYIVVTYGTVETIGIIALLSLKAPITTAADDIHNFFFSLFFRENKT